MWKTIQTKSSELRSGLTESGGFSRFSKVFRQRGNAEILIFFFLTVLADLKSYVVVAIHSVLTQ